jgi:1-aminocyclopropane-1-carboxylate deaminase
MLSNKGLSTYNGSPSLFNIHAQKIYHPLLNASQIDVNILRCDLIDPITGGNKWFKLFLNIEECTKQSKTTILSFGGPYSNHLAALAKYAKQHSISTIGIVRGEEVSNNTLTRAIEDGMQLHFVDRTTYRQYRDEFFWSELTHRFGDVYIIPEGGCNTLGVIGTQNIASSIPHHVTHILLPVGTGATMAGIILGAHPSTEIIGIPVLKNSGYLEGAVKKILHETAADLSQTGKYSLNNNYAMGGYAKSTEELNLFIRDFHSYNPAIPIEPIYTGKMMFAFFDLVKKDFFSQGSSIMLIHTGGMQYLIS